MNKAKLKSYAPQARKDFIAAVVARANLLGISEKNGMLEIATSEKKGDVTLIAGQAWPAKVHEQRERLIKRIQKTGVGETAEAIAYTWFNRFAALRYMEIHDYLGHGHRVISSRDGGLPEILTHATELTEILYGLNATQVADMKLAGNRDGELYRMLLVAQCNALSSTMPFLFERIDDETELLLPDNLLRTDSIVAKLVAGVPEEDWADVEIIGWLYQFYIIDEKARIDAKLKKGEVVLSPEIPAKTQLFTPNWIVQYLVQNSVGRLWLMANPQSTLAKEWPYYITPAEQTPEVQAQLDALIQTRVREDGDTLNPESITVLDPACGSGHIVVVAYDVLKAIYLERGYRVRDIPRLILEKNLYGLDIDDRAAQMAGFALLMKARADDRRLFTATDDAGNLQPPKLNVLSLQESKGLSVDELATHLAPFKVQQATITALVDTFEHAKTFGSLIQIPYALNTHLAVLPEVLALVKQSGDMYAIAAADDLLPLVQQAQVLAMQFDAVVANPPYMGGKGMNQALKDYAKSIFPDSKSDLFSIFMERGFGWCKPTGFHSMVTMHNWMFLSSYEAMRERLLQARTLNSMVHMGNGVMGIAFGTAATVMLNQHISNYAGDFCYCENDELTEAGVPRSFPIRNERLKTAMPDDFKKIPSSPIAYWITDRLRNIFSKGVLISCVAEVKQGLATSNNERFLRMWFEVSIARINFRCASIDETKTSNVKWYPHNKGGSFRRWYGNFEYIVNWQNNGRELWEFTSTLSQGSNVRLKSRDYYFKEAASWSDVTSGNLSGRYIPEGSIFDTTGPSIFYKEKFNIKFFVAFLNTNLCQQLVFLVNPTMHFTLRDANNFPLPEYIDVNEVEDLSESAISLSKKDWNSSEMSWDFQCLPILSELVKVRTIQESWAAWVSYTQSQIQCLKALEEQNNRLFINAYGLQDELSPDVPESQITLARADREKDCQRMISYAIGCMMGRYSLDEPGLVYAHAGNVGFEPGRYTTFPADADGIVPITDELWFADDAPSRIREFLRAVWGPDTLEENMAWLAESLGTKVAETPDETIRRYIADKFFKDHLQTYKKRPIYWLFSSGKQGAFQALVYLHRYHESTLARLRAEYVVPLTGKIQSRIDMLQKDALAASSTAARNKIAKQIESLKKKHVELLAYDEKLRHYADMRITLDLDDGVKVNYGKFGDLLAEVKAVTGGTGDE